MGEVYHSYLPGRTRGLNASIFNAFQNYVKNKVIPDMVTSFNDSGVEVDEETFEQFFKDIDTYPEIAKFISAKKQTPKVIVKKSSITAPKTKKN